MNIDGKNTGAYPVRKEAPALPKNGFWRGGADIRNEYVLGLRFKPAPVFHFLGAGLRAGDKYARIPGNLLETIQKNSRLLRRAVMGVVFGE